MFKMLRRVLGLTPMPKQAAISESWSGYEVPETTESLARSA